MTSEKRLSPCRGRHVQTPVFHDFLHFHWVLKGYIQPIGMDISIAFSTVFSDSLYSLPGDRHEIAGQLIFIRKVLRTWVEPQGRVRGWGPGCGMARSPDANYALFFPVVGGAGRGGVGDPPLKTT